MNRNPKINGHLTPLSPDESRAAIVAATTTESIDKDTRFKSRNNRLLLEREEESLEDEKLIFVALIEEAETIISKNVIES